MVEEVGSISPPSEDKPVTPVVVKMKSEESNRTPFWVLLSVSVGFLLPVCSCAVLFVVLTLSFSFLGSGPAMTSTGLGDAVAIVRVEGPITSGDESDFGTGAVSGVIMSDLREADDDPSVKAIVLRVDSPGGTVTGSAQIYEVVKEVEKPIVVSMVSVAASGGYYVSAPADYIMARPDTVTGSIGVILTLYNAEALLDEIGVEVTTITSGPNKALGTPWEEITPEQRQILEEFVDESYEDFIRVVADGRGMSVEVVRELADGRIYTGRQALDVGLVDELGNLQDAIDKAAALGGISGKPRVVEYEHLPDFTTFLRGFSNRLNQSEADQIIDIVTRFTTPSLEYRYVGPQSR